MKVYVCDTWDALSDIGESTIDKRAYVTREAAERRAERIRRRGHDGIDEYARVVELELCAEPSNTDRLIAERTTWYLHAKNVEAENAKLRKLVDAWMGCGTRYHTMQGGCPMFDADAEDFCKAASLARELGIEVD